MGAPEVPQAERLHVELDPAAVAGAYAVHRRRFAREVAALDEDALRTQSRCSKWSVADVLRHGADVDEWMQAIWSGGRPPFTSFDPVLTPHEFVVAGRAMSDAEARDRYVRSAEVMASDVAGSGSERWGTTSVSPIGFVPWWMSMLHVFYDSWLHERDVFPPLGRTTPVEADEAVPVLAYSLALVGTLIAEPTDVVVAGVHLRAGEPPVVASPTGSTTLHPRIGEIIDALSGRGAITDALGPLAPDVAGRFGALARLFGVGEAQTISS